MKTDKKNEKGYLIVESAIVYPIIIVMLVMFLYILLLFAQRAQMTAAAEQTLIYVKYLCEGGYTDIDVSDIGNFEPPENDPQLYITYSELFRTPSKTLSELENGDKIKKIFRHFMGNTSLIGSLDDIEVKCTARNYVIFTQLNLDVSFSIKSPVNFSFIGAGTLNDMKIKVSSMGVISNNSETIRTTQFISYCYNRSGLAKKVEEFGNDVEKKFSAIIDKCKNWIGMD